MYPKKTRQPLRKGPVSGQPPTTRRLEAWFTKQLNGSKAEYRLLWKTAKESAGIAAIGAPVLGLTGYLAQMNYAEQFGMAAGSMEVQLHQMLGWGWRAWVTNLGWALIWIVYPTLLLVIVPALLKGARSSKVFNFTYRLGTLPMAIGMLFALPVFVGLTGGRQLAEDTVLKADYSIRFVVDPKLEHSFDPVFLRCNKIRGDLRRVWSSKESTVVYSLSKRRVFEIHRKDIQNLVLEPLPHARVKGFLS